MHKLLLAGFLLCGIGKMYGQSAATAPSPAAAQPVPATAARCTYSGDRVATVRVLVNAAGEPKEIQLSESSGDACADSLALEAVGKYHFPKRDVPVRILISVDLPDRSSAQPAAVSN